jgi:archaemetzincin
MLGETSSAPHAPLEVLHLISVGILPNGTLDRLAAGLAAPLRASCRVERQVLDPAFAADASRGQTYSTALLARLAAAHPPPGHVLLGVTSLDLFVPILTFVFGEAQLSGPCAVVSTHRLRDEFYGLTPDPAAVDRRLLIEALHEFGHTQGLRHCPDWSCPMASAHTIEALDLKQPRFCGDCASRLATAR